MKLYYLISFLLLCSIGFKAQETKDSIPKATELKVDQRKAWSVIEQEWFSKEYGKILKENKLKMNCSGCESISMNTVITIDSIGKLKEYKVVKSRKCATTFSKKLEQRFMKWFLTFNFPKELFNSKFEIHLGTGLKC